MCIRYSHTSVVGAKQTHLLDTLLKRNVQVVKVFAPEHGFRGNADAGETVKNGKDSRTGTPVSYTHLLDDGKKHDGRAPDYDDYTTKGLNDLPGLNGDLLLWDDVLQRSIELSSMGIRVDKEALQRQDVYKRQ